MNDTHGATDGMGATSGAHAMDGTRRATCLTCPRACRVPEGGVGFCRARRNVGGTIVAENYGCVTSLAVDPVEKKPLARFHPGSLLLSVGSYGCNLRCPFCQNHRIAQAGRGGVPWRRVFPERLVDLACEERRRDPRMIGIAYTYNEPLVGWEYVRDCSREAHRHGLVNVLVSSGYANAEVIDCLAGLIDAANIDLKGTAPTFCDECGFDVSTVKGTISRLVASGAHVEVTTLVVPGKNDTPDQVATIARWLCETSGDIVYHLTRFFPCWRMSDAAPTPVERIYALADVAREYLDHVYVGNC